MTCNFLPERTVPGAELLMHEIVLLWNRMGPRDDADAVSLLDEIAEKTDPRAGGVPNDQTCGKMYDIGAISNHFFGGVLNIASRAPVACGVSHQGCFLIPVKAECAFLLLQRRETFAACAAPVTITNNDADLHEILVAHEYILAC